MKKEYSVLFRVYTLSVLLSKYNNNNNIFPRNKKIVLFTEKAEYTYINIIITL